MIEATVVDATHLELQKPLPGMVGQRILVQLTPPSDEQTRLLHELRLAYAAMTESETQTEIALAEEGLHGQLPPSVEFPGEIEESWWQ